MHNLILALNAGSSSLKATLYGAAQSPARLAVVSMTGIGSDSSKITLSLEAGKVVSQQPVGHVDPSRALTSILDALAEEFKLEGIGVVGHRLVHGGTLFSDPVVLDAAVLRDLESLIQFAPDHLPQAIAAIKLLTARWPGLTQVGSFDSHFHRTMPMVASHYALPAHYFNDGVRRFGFHGLSCASVMQQLSALDPARARGRTIIAHLGSGASLTAVRHGQSIDTSMGFAPDSGLVMSSRSGDLDAGAVLYLIRERKCSAEDVNQLINKESGLLGVSGQSGSMEALLEHASTSDAARAAIDMFCYRAQKYLGAYAAALGGLDTIVFCGGIGENAPEIRHRICAGQQWAGVHLDEAANRRNADVISTASSPVCVRVVATDEDRMIAQDAIRFLPA